MSNAFARTREGMIKLGDVFWGRVNSCRFDRSVSFRVIGGAAVALIIVGAGPTLWGWCAVPHRHAHVGVSMGCTNSPFDGYHYIRPRLRWRHGSADE